MTPRLALFLSCVLCLAPACRKGGDGGEGQAPPAPEAPKLGLCANGGGKIDDLPSQPLLPRENNGYCVDPNAPVRAYGKQAKGTIGQTCTELFDGECVTYQNYGVERVVSLRYVDGRGSVGMVGVNLSRFENVTGAFGFFTKRVVADTDPAQLTTKPLAAGAMGAMGTAVAYVWRGQYVAELTYTNEQESPKALAASGNSVLPPLAKAIGDLLVGEMALPAAARLLPEADRLPLGIEFEPRDGLGIVGVGPAATGHYRAGEGRFAIMVAVRANDEAGEDVMKTLRKQPGAKESRGKSTALLTLTVRRSEDSPLSPSDAAGKSIGDPAAELGPKTEWVLGQSGNVVVGVGDDERALQAAASAQKETVGLSVADKRARLEAILTSLLPTPGTARP